MLANRNDPAPRRLLATALVILTVVIIRDEYTAETAPGWPGLVCLGLAVMGIVFSRKEH